jgi:hypothetical protein
MRNRTVLSFPLLAGLFTIGCILEVANRSALDACNLGDTCASDETARFTSCQSVSSSISTGAICTRSCSVLNSDCGPNGVCVVSGGLGQCFRLCTAVSCPLGGGTVCTALPLTDGSGFQTQICAPGSSFGGSPTTTPITTVSVYNKCDPGNPSLRCGAGLTCQRSAVGTRAPGFTCTQACTSTDQCPGGAGFAACVNGFCAAVCSNPGAIDARCSMFGTSCVSANNMLGQPVSFCAP